MEIQATLDAEPDIVHSTPYAGDQSSFMKQAKQFEFFQNIGHYTLVITMSELYTLGNESPMGTSLALSQQPRRGLTPTNTISGPNRTLMKME